jgi:hypothetical protein
VRREPNFRRMAPDMFVGFSLIEPEGLDLANHGKEGYILEPEG